MPLDASELYTGFAPIRASHVKQYFDWITGIMTDQAGTLKNKLSVGGNQLTTDDLLTLIALASQTGYVLRINGASGNTLQLGMFKLAADANPTFNMDPNGKMSWGAGGGSAVDTSLERAVANILLASGGFDFSGIATPAAPAASRIRVYAKTDNRLYSRINGGAETYFGVNTPAARAYNSANISINSATLTALTLNSERFDTDTIHSTVTNTSRLTATTAGVYLIIAQVEFAANVTGDRHVIIKLNNTTNIGYDVQTAAVSAGDPLLMQTSTLWNMAAADYVECVVYQDSGAPLNVVATDGRSPEFSMVRVG